LRLNPLFTRHSSSGPPFCPFHHGRLAAPFDFSGEMAQPDGVRIGRIQRQPVIRGEPLFKLLIAHLSPDTPPFVVYHLLFFFLSRRRHSPSIAEISSTIISLSSPTVQ
jgi:hypothetical protein